MPKIIAIDARLIDQTGVGRYTRNLYAGLKKIDKKNKYLLLKPKIAWHSLSEQIIFPLWLLSQKIDLIHFPYFSFPLLCPKKFVVTIHDLIPWHFKTGKASALPVWLYSIKHFFYKQLLYWGARRAKKIVAVSQYTKKEIIKCLKVKPEKVSVIYEGVDEKILNTKNQISKKHIKNEKSNNKYFLYVGNAYPHKNLERLINAFIEFFNHHSSSITPKLILVGPDDYFYKKLKLKVKQLGLHNRVIFYGSASDEQLIGLYKNALAFINPSLMEGFGLPGLEAMACGCPVVCSKIEVFKEIYGEAALFFDPKDKEDIKSKIKEITNSKEKRQKLVKKGLIQLNKYSWKKCAQQTLKIYESSFSL